MSLGFGVVDTAGTFVVKQGIGGGWTTETTNVRQIAIAGSAGGPYIGALLGDGAFVAKQGIGGGVVTEADNVDQMAMAGPHIGGHRHRRKRSL